MSQRRLSQKSGVSTSYISKLEADNSIRDRSPNLAILEALACSLTICVRDLVFYPCIECSQAEKCVNIKKDMREPDVIIEEILSQYR
jgi:transcriptional regulator with XRE-family HTH domain